MSHNSKRLGGGRMPAFWLTAIVLSFGSTRALAQDAGQNAGQQQTAQGNSLAQHGRQVLDQISAVFEEAAAKLNPSVVAIYSESTVTVQSQPFGGDALRQFFGDQFLQRYFGQMPGQQQRTVHALGSGVIASADGYILTNNHVVANAQKLTVVMPNGKREPAKIVGTDPETDLALIKVDGHDLPAATFGDSDAVKIGQWVIAVGNPFELLHTTTAGIISAKGRAQVGITPYEDFLQTDAAINPGNSGGPLADLDGRVIGINSAISTPSGGSVGLGFAIPINLAKNVMEQLKAHGRVIRGYLGVLLQPLTSDLAEGLGIPESTKGVLIAEVEQGSPADQAGVRQGDVVTQFNGQAVQTVPRLQNFVSREAPGTKVQLSVLRNGKTTTLPVTLGEKPQQGKEGNQGQGGPPNPQKLGIRVQTLTPDLAQQLGYQGESGAVIVQVESGSVAENAGLQRGDLIKEVNREQIRSAQDLADKIGSLKSGSTAALLVQRGNQSFFAAVEIP